MAGPAWLDPAVPPDRDMVPVDAGWKAAATVPDALADPSQIDGLDWLPATVPGTAAGARRAAGLDPGDLDAEDWWFRTSFRAAPAGRGEIAVLCLDGLATLAEVFLNGECVLRSESMFAGHRIDVGSRLRGDNELAIRFRALTPLLAIQRRPRARWRTRLVADNNLRWFRTALLGRIPGFAPRPAPVGPWRPVRLERIRGVVADKLEVRPRLEGDVGILRIRARLRIVDGRPRDSVALSIDGPTGPIVVPLDAGPGGGRATGSDETDRGPNCNRLTRGVATDFDPSDGEILIVDAEARIGAVAAWWPHTHGAPALYTVELWVGSGADRTTIPAGRTGFRSIAPGLRPGHDIDRDGLFVHVNGVPVFVRGALWTPLDIVTLGATVDELRAALELVRAAGMNMVRLPGFGVYEQAVFHDLCDELGILVWQDLMFMSMDYPFDDPAFGALAAVEAREVAGRLAGRPSSAVLCGNSEVEQQVAMLGLDPALARMPYFDAIVPGIAAEVGLDVPCVPSVPFGGDLPMRPDRGVTGYYGVGGYRAPLSDARTSGVRFAGECLAFANVPDDDVLADLVPVPPYEAFVHNPYWKAGVARDAGSGWDFDDLRDVYLELLFGVDPGALRRSNHDRYLELSRAVTGEVMEAVFGEWRRTGSPSGGGMILWLRDLVAGAGWGIVDHRGRPKVAWHHLRRALAPTTVWLTDEWTGGVIAHVANDGPDLLSARLRIALYSDFEVPVGSAEASIELPPHGAAQHDVEAVIGHFVDASWAFRFGPPTQDAIVASLEHEAEGGVELLGQAFHFPAGRPLTPIGGSHLGLGGDAEPIEGTASQRLVITSRRLAYGVRLHVPGFLPSDDAFSVEPGGRRVIRLDPIEPSRRFEGGAITALNLIGRAAIRTRDLVQ